jgi:ADP-heptose:LPS heptosyltransferase
MSTARKVALDRIVGVPSAWALNLAARSLSPIVKRSHKIAAENVHAIVVAKLLGMGSIIQATPLLRGLKRAYPNARLYFVTTVANRELVERLGCIDQGLYLDDRKPGRFAKNTVDALRVLVKQGVDLYFDLEVYSGASSCLSLISLARNRFGLYRHSARFKRGLFTHLLYFNIAMPIRQIYLQMLAMTGARGPFSDELEPIAVSEKDRAGLRTKLAKVGLTPESGYIVVNPNASDLLLERRWPIDHFVRLLELMVAAGERPILIGAPSERPYVESLWSRLPPAAQKQTLNMAGEVSLGELFALVDGARAVVTNDTGPMHVSFALKRPTVCLFGPGSPEHYGSDRDNVAILYKGIFCSPCIYETDEPPCGGNNVCMQWITPEETWRTTERLLAGKGRDDWRARRTLQLCGEDGSPLGLLNSDRRRASP